MTLLIPALGVTETALTEAYLLHVHGDPGSFAWMDEDEPEPDTAPAAPLPNQR